VTTGPPHRFEWVVFVLSSAGVLAGLGWLLGAGLVDDTYIFLRYAENIVQGAGAVFNTGERVDGFSSDAWTLLLAAVRLFTARMESAALALSVASALGVIVVVYYVLRRARVDAPDRWTSVVLALGLLSLPATVYWAFAGMEHPLFTLAVTATLASAMADDRHDMVSFRTAVLLVLAVVTRPEGVLLVAWVTVFSSFRHGAVDRHWFRFIALPIGGAVAAFGILSVAHLAYFGSMVPNTFYAKVIPNTWDRLGGGAFYLQRSVVAHAPVLLLAVALYSVAWKLALVPAVPVAFLGGWIGLWSVYIEYAGGDHFGMFRFFLPVLPACVLLIGLLWGALRGHLRPVWTSGFPAIVAAAFVLSIVGGMWIDGYKARMEPIGAQDWGKAGRWIAENTPPNTLVATNVIGAIGYFSRRRIVDMAGLVDPVVAREGAVFTGAAPGHARYHTDYIFQRAPDLVVYWTSGEVGVPPFTPIRKLKPPWHFSLIHFVLDPRCAERYEHVSVPLADGSWVEMQKKRTFHLPPGYLAMRSDFPQPQ
jgi:arabinofuranosyltransferase